MPNLVFFPVGGSYATKFGCLCLTWRFAIYAHVMLQVNSQAAGAQVFRQMIWMRAYGKECMKKSCIWSNSRLVSKLHVQDVSKALSALLAVVLCLCFWQMYSVLQTLFAMQELRAKAKPLCKTYVDANGKKRYSGIPKKMKSSQLGPCVLVSAGIYVIYVYMHSLIQVVSGLRSYTCAFGYRIAELLPQLPEGVWGFKNPAKDCRLPNARTCCKPLCFS